MLSSGAAQNGCGNFFPHSPLRSPLQSVPRRAVGNAARTLCTLWRPALALLTVVSFKSVFSTISSPSALALLTGGIHWRNSFAQAGWAPPPAKAHARKPLIMPAIARSRARIFHQESVEGEKFAPGQRTLSQSQQTRT